MNFARTGLTAIITVLLLADLLVWGGTSPDRFQPIDVFQLEYVSDPQISPDGKQVVYVRNSVDIMSDRLRSTLWLVFFDDREQRPLTDHSGDQFSPRWSPDGKRLLYISSEGGRSQLFLRWMDTGQTARLTNLQTSPSGLSWSPDGRWIAFSMLVKESREPMVRLPSKPEGAQWAAPAIVIEKLLYRADGAGYLKDGYRQIFLLSAEGGTPRQLTSGTFHHGGRLAWTPDSRSLVFSANRSPNWELDPLNSELYRLDIADGGFKALTERRGPDSNPAVSPDGSRVAYLGFDDRLQGYQLRRLYLTGLDGEGSRLLIPDFDRSVQSPVWSGDGSGVYVQYSDQGNTKIGFISLQGEHKLIASNVGGTSLGRPYSSGSFSVSSNGRIAYTVTGPARPADLALGPDKQGEFRQVTRLNDDLLGHKELATVEEIRFKSSFDGRPVQGWIAKPPGFDPSRKYPLVLEIHGGPFANYGDRFSAEVQLYAAARYVVLYTNPRGSTSYGEEFGNLIHHNYPGEDYDDLMSGVDAVIEQGYVDPSNLFVTGGSGGGVLTSWIVGKTSRFRAAVVAKPVINWYSFVLTADSYNFFYKYWFPGFPWEHAEHYLKRSPLSLVGNVKTPTMLLTGEEDYRTPMSETEQYYQALKLRQVETALVRIPGASHGIARRPSHLISKVAHVLAWFGKYRKQDP